MESVPGRETIEILQELEDKYRRLKRIVADQALSVQVLEDLLGNKS